MSSDKRIVDLTGQRFGMLIVIDGDVGRNKHNHKLVRVRCDCGKELVKAQFHIKRKKSPHRSCGCNQDRIKPRHDCMGKQYGRLRVVGGPFGGGRNSVGSYDRVSWLCECECGSRVQVSYNLLQQGLRTKCGSKCSAARKYSSPAVRMRHHSAKYKAAKIQRTPRYSDDELIALHHEWAAWYTKMTGVKHQVDHYYPLQGEKLSGLNVETNLIILDKSSNSAKCNRDPIEFFGEDLFP